MLGPEQAGGESHLSGRGSAAGGGPACVSGARLPASLCRAGPVCCRQGLHSDYVMQYIMVCVGSHSVHTLGDRAALTQREL